MDKDISISEIVGSELVYHLYLNNNIIVLSFDTLKFKVFFIYLHRIIYRIYIYGL